MRHPLFVRNPRIEEAIDQIDHEVGNDEDYGVDNYFRHDERIIAVECRLHEWTANARYKEH